MKNKKIFKNLLIQLGVVLIFLASIIIFTSLNKTSFALEPDVITDIITTDKIRVDMDLHKATGNLMYHYTVKYNITNLDPEVAYVKYVVKSSLYSYPIYESSKVLKAGTNILIDDEQLGDVIQMVVMTIVFYDENDNILDLSDTDMEGTISIETSKKELEVTIFDYEYWEAPKTGKYLIELWGAEGNYYPEFNNDNAGKGAYVSGYVELKKGDSLYVYTGENAKKAGNFFTPAFNAGSRTIEYNSGHHMSSGGGATDIRYFGSYEPTSAELNWDSTLGLRSRVMVAGGGGGTLQQITAHFKQTGYGGSGGGLQGYSGYGLYTNLPSGTTRPPFIPQYQTGGSQVSGGQGGGICEVSTSNGKFGVGGDGGNQKPVDNLTKCKNEIFALTGNKFDDWIYSAGNIGGGGGGGYYGGGGGGSLEDCHNGGAGGSSFISGHQGAVAINTNGTPKCTENQAKNDINCSKHYSGLVFTETEMIDGEGYEWTNIKGSRKAMPKPTGGFYPNGRGHKGTGAARITLVTTEEVTEDEAAKISLRKYEKTVGGANTTNQIAGAIFGLYRNSGRKELIEKYVTDENGYLEITGLAKNKNYYLQEITAPTGYNLDPNKYAFTTSTNEIVITAYNQRKPGSVELNKTNYTGRYLVGTKFNLYREPNILIGSYTTDMYGKITASNLEWGNYYFVETEVLPGYELDPTPITFTVDAKHTNLQTKNIVNEEQKGKVILTKYNSAENQKLQGAIYNLYKSDGALYAENLETNAAGELKVDNIPWGSYYFKEIKAPNGYGLSDELLRFSVSNVTAGMTQHITAIDPEELKEIILTKKVKISDIVFEHGDPTFIFELDGIDINDKSHTYYKAITITATDVKNLLATNPGAVYIEKSILFPVLSGTYTAIELDTVRYKLSNVTNIVNGIEFDGEVTFDLVDAEKLEGRATFQNDKIDQSGVNHTTSVVNIIKKRAQLTAITSDYKGTGTIYAGTSINRNNLDVYAFYDDGTGPIKLANAAYSLSPEPLPANGEGTATITVTYTENGITRKTTFNVSIVEFTSITASYTSATVLGPNAAININNVDITAHYSNGSSKSMPRGNCSLNPTNVPSSGTGSTLTVTVTCVENGISKSANITVPVQYRVYYFNNGTHNLTGGWNQYNKDYGSTLCSACNVAINGTRLEMYTDQGSEFRSNNQVNLTNISTITYVYTCSNYYGGGSTGWGLRVGTTTVNTNGYSYTTRTINVSSLSGNHYLDVKMTNARCLFTQIYGE